MGERLSKDGRRRERGVEEPNPAGALPGEAPVGGADRAVESEGLLLNPIFLPGGMGAQEAHFGVDIEIEGEVGFDPLAKEAAGLCNRGDAELAGGALVGDGGVVEPVAQDDVAAREGREDQFVELLGP
jgi:hypothetical protein